ncbi:MAG: family 43 glycosylhydrolase [Lachnospiraceae bacterium]|nr:family 43 glycosylhydrolase [Lachnospiraceae bacterium]
MKINPLLKLDYPDPDVIRVDDTYYMVSTTMYFMPGCEILRSYDLVNWEHAAYVYDTLDSIPAQRIEGEENIYGQGMWAASLRYHDGFFYICFVANDTHKTYVYSSSSITGPWKKSTLNGFYHDNSILFDNDGRIYIVYGNKEIYIRELKGIPDKEDSSEDGTRLILSDEDSEPETLILRDTDDVYLGYEGSHLYKISGKYYLFMIHMPKSTARRTEGCYVADSPFGPYYGMDVMDDDRGFRKSGCAQGGIVCDPDGKEYAILFQDSGAVGRIPILMPVSWKKTDLGSLADTYVTSGEDRMIRPLEESYEAYFPTFGNDGIIPSKFEVTDLYPGYNYTPLVSSDDFKDASDIPGINDTFGFKSCWQFSHEPDMSLITRDPEEGTFTVTTDKICKNLVQARNVLTQRTRFPGCACNVEVDAANLKDGDVAGLCILESCYAFVGITKEGDDYYVIMCSRTVEGGMWGERHDTEPGKVMEKVKLSSTRIKLHVAVCFDHTLLNGTVDPSKTMSLTNLPKADDTAYFGYKEPEGTRHSIGAPQKLVFKLDHFTGARVGLFVFSTKETGGSATFSKFKYS